MRKLTIGLVLMALLTAPALATSHGVWAGNYAGPGTLVASFSFPTGGEASATFVDNGAIVCEDTNNDGIYDKNNGGVCIPFGNVQGDSILVEDALSATQVAFQVCVDMNGDGLCGDGLFAAPLGGCKDVLLFSHNSFDGGFDNPMLLPHDYESDWLNCGAGGFPGYIVIICAGAHQTHGDPDGHTHDVTFGQVHTTLGGTWPRGDYCGAPTAVKAYEVR